MAEWSIADIPADKLRVDPDIQRGLNRARVARESEQLDPDGLGVITVSDRGHGDLVIVDGQHRTEFVKKALGASHPMTCKVFTGLTRQDEARLFRVLNNMVKVGSLEGFHVRVTENDPIAVYLKKIVEKHGWPLGPGPVNTHFSAVSALERVYELDPRSDPTAVERAIGTLDSAWGHADGVMAGTLVEGLGRLYARHRSAMDAGAMIDRLAKNESGAIGLIGQARVLRNLRRGSVVDAMAEILTDLYNLRRKPKTQLPPWRA